MLEKVFKLSENKTDAKTEILAGITTFMTMASRTFVADKRIKMIPSANTAVSVGIGLFIAFIGLQNAKIVIGGSCLHSCLSICLIPSEL